jgi:hypothetical protein
MLSGSSQEHGHACQTGGLFPNVVWITVWRDRQIHDCLGQVSVNTIQASTAYQVHDQGKESFWVVEGSLNSLP